MPLRPLPWLLLSWAFIGGTAWGGAVERAGGWIACTEFRTNLPTRHANFGTMRPWLLRADGSGGAELAPGLVNDPDMWCSFEGWSADGRFALLTRTLNP